MQQEPEQPVGEMVEPLTVAKAAAGAVSAADTLSKNSVVQALFLPSATAFGDHWGDQVRERLAAAATAKREANLKAHLEGVGRASKEEFKPDPTLANAWIDGAQQIDPVDEDLATAWRATLVAIGNGNLLRKRLLETVQSLTPEEAHAFMNIAHRSRSFRRHHTEHRRRLQELGLIQRPWDAILSATGMLAFLSIGLVSTAFYIMPSLMVAIGMVDQYRVDLLRSGGSLLGSISLLFIIPIFYTFITQPRLSQLGLGLARLSIQLRGPSEAPTSGGEPKKASENADEPAATPKKQR